ncbi:MAG: SRPBCC family protein [Actinomycetota bacterium]
MTDSTNTTNTSNTAIEPTDHRFPAAGRGTIVLDDVVDIARPPAEVFDNLADVSNDPVWQDGLIEARFTSAGPVMVGSTGVHVAKPFGRRVEVGWRLTAFEPNREMAWTFVSGPFTGGEGYRLEPTATGTRVTHWAVLRPHGLLRVLRPLIAGSFVTQSQTNMEAFRDLLEAGAG